MPQEYQPAPDVKAVARRLIDDFHTHLATVRIEYVFCTEQLKEKGKVVWGRAKKVSGLNAWLADEDRDYDAKSPEDFFVVEIHRGTWLMIDEKSRRALVDHELCHFWVDENGNLAVLGHDLEEFNAVVRRHGLWADDIKFFLEAAGRQKDLFERTKEEDDDNYFERAPRALQGVDRARRAASRDQGTNRRLRTPGARGFDTDTLRNSRKRNGSNNQ